MTETDRRDRTAAVAACGRRAPSAEWLDARLSLTPRQPVV
jgi:hypothetical protein